MPPGSESSRECPSRERNPPPLLPPHDRRLDDPPGTRRGLNGLQGVPDHALTPEVPRPSSCSAVLRTIAAPFARSLATTAESGRAGGSSARAADPPVAPGRLHRAGPFRLRTVPRL